MKVGDLVDVQTKFHVLRPTRFHGKFVLVYGTITLYR